MLNRTADTQKRTWWASGEVSTHIMIWVLYTIYFSLLLHFFYGDLMMLFALLSGINTKQHKRSETMIDCSKKDQ